MSNQIQLEYGRCPKCGLPVDSWTVKAEVVNGVLGVRCPSCREVVKLTMKGGQEEQPNKYETGEVETQHPEDLTTNKEE